MADPPALSERGSRTAVNLAYYGLAQVANAMLALVLVGLLSRALGTGGFGAFSFSFVVASFGALLADFGVGPWLTRAAAQYAGQATLLLSEAFRLRALTSVAAGALTLLLAGLYLHDAGRLTNVACMLAYVFLLGYVGVYEAMLMGKERADRVAISMGAGKVLELTAVLAWVATGAAGNVAGAAAALAAACAIRLVLVRVMTRSALRVAGEMAGEAPARDPGLERDARRRMLREALPFAAGSVVWTTYFKVDVLILERLGTATGLGLYTAAYRVLEALVLFPRSVAGVVYPVVSAAWSQKTLTASLLSRPARALMALALACAAGIWVLSPGIMRFLFGPSFAGGAGALRVLGLALVPLFLNYLLGMVLSATHRQGTWLWLTLLGFVVNVAANLMLIPRLGFEGAAWATLVSEGFMLLLLGVAVVPRHGRLLSFGWLARAAVAAAAMGVVVSYVPGPLAARIAAGAGAFLLLVAGLRVVLPADWSVALELARKARARAMPETREAARRPQE